MIYEIGTYTIRRRGLPEYYEKFGEIFERRQAIARMVGIFHVDYGELNRVMHIWEYESAGHREETCRAIAENEWWPPPTDHLLEKQVSKIATTPGFRPEPRLGEFGSVYEFRTYTLFPGKLGEMEEKWAPIIASREELSPLAAVFMTEVGELNQWIHVWAYKDPNHRNEVREKMQTLPNFPSPEASKLIQSQVSELWIPGPYSLMR